MMELLRLPGRDSKKKKRINDMNNLRVIIIPARLKKPKEIFRAVLINTGRPSTSIVM
jgi:hypothetical protein